MIGGIRAVTDFESRDRDPSLSVEEKLSIIERTEVTIRPTTHGDKIFDDDYMVTLPFVDGGLFTFGISGYPEVVFTDFVNVGDAELYGHGIGSRLLRAAFRYATEKDESVSEFHTGWARFGLVNATVAVLGEENVGVDCESTRYGWGGDKPLEAVLEDFPHLASRGYEVGAIAARIDRDLALSFDMPRYILPKARREP